MNRRLMVLNVALLAGVVYAGIQFRQQWKASHERIVKSAPGPLKTLPALKYSPLLPEPPVLAMTYAEVAQRTLFDPSRNPNVPVEKKPEPPPPPPMPPLPSYHGMMNIGDAGPMAFLTYGGGQNKATHPGESIGPFKLLDVNSDEVIFEWDGKPVRQSLSKPTPEVSNQVDSRTEAPAAAQAPPPKVLVGPGEQTQFGARTCNINDGNPPGAVVDGLRKVIYTSPFGQSCGWEK